MMVRAAILAMICGGPAAAWAEDSYPYTGYVNVSDVYLRSGPGENYYPVSKLERGQQVEVYRHDPGGWYAIRPTQDCFSWVSAEFVEPAEGNLAVVKCERLVSRVGSVFSDVRDVIQVRLDRDEVVEVIEAKRFNSGPAAQTWYKIAPPAGEFRWVSGKFIDRELPEDKPREASPENNLLVARHSRSAETDRSPEADEAEDRDAAGDRWWEHDEAAELSDEELDEEEYPVRRAGHQTAVRVNSRRSEHARDSRAAQDEDRDPPSASMDEDEAELDDREMNFKDLAAELDLELSARVAEEPAQWRFGDLKRRAEAALARADTAVDRGRVRRVLRKIENFSELQRRYQTVMNVRSETDRLNARRPSYERPATISVGLGRDRSRFDGVGRLTQVLSRDPGNPQFALLDSTGQIAYYVSPSPGVNLRRFLNQEVGINGTLGYLPEQHARHVTAQRIVSVDERLLR
ncbi:MAG TPA: SH3 domain-containing protein [Pirellulales bacterium]|nr:SH3 domain-containing protein [Pirellulales bacterium]